MSKKKSEIPKGYQWIYKYDYKDPIPVPDLELYANASAMHPTMRIAEVWHRIDSKAAKRFHISGFYEVDQVVRKRSSFLMKTSMKSWVANFNNLLNYSFSVLYEALSPSSSLTDQQKVSLAKWLVEMHIGGPKLRIESYNRKETTEKKESIERIDAGVNPKSTGGLDQLVNDFCKNMSKEDMDTIISAKPEDFDKVIKIIESHDASKE